MMYYALNLIFMLLSNYSRIFIVDVYCSLFACCHQSQNGVALAYSSYMTKQYNDRSNCHSSLRPSKQRLAFNLNI